MASGKSAETPDIPHVRGSEATAPSNPTVEHYAQLQRADYQDKQLNNQWQESIKFVTRPHIDNNISILVDFAYQAVYIHQIARMFTRDINHEIFTVTLDYMRSTLGPIDEVADCHLSTNAKQCAVCSFYIFNAQQF